MSMPTDIVYEILSHLAPLDLLRMSRTSKAFRGILMRRECTWLWRSSREKNDVPNPFPTMSEPAFAALLFERHCQFCGVVPVRNIIWSAFVRCCKRCLPIQFTLPPPAWNILPMPIFSILPHLIVDNSLVPDEWGSGERLYLKKHAENMVEQYLSQPVGTTRSWVSETAETYERAYEHIPVCEERDMVREAAYKSERRALKLQRTVSILAKLEELGWSSELTSDQRFLRHKLVSKPQILTERIWVNVKPTLEMFLTSLKEHSVH
ncbi:hypothetical protein V5O48_005009 [Marasmius crinis-equi]|uniref:F-box domain-containing protein n=1 Tax=Marasmius crinis-equi TaxID=585013 RepID=A0ABR3FNI5_9AGAR